MRRLLSSQENIIDAWLQLRSNAGTTKLYNFPDSLCPVYARISLATQSSLQTMRSGNLSGSNQTSQIRICSLASSQGIYGARYGLRSTGLQDKWDSRVEGGEGLPSPEAGSQWEGTWHLERVKEDQYTGTKARHVHSWETLSLLLLWRETEKRCGSWELTDCLIVSSTTRGRTHKPIIVLLWIVHQTHPSTVSDEKIPFSSNFTYCGRWS